MLLDLLRSSTDNLLRILPFLSFEDIQNLCLTSPDFDHFFSSVSFRMWKSQISPIKKIFNLNIICSDTVPVADEACIGVAHGSSVAFFSLTVGTPICEVSIPGMICFAHRITKMKLSPKKFAILVENSISTRMLIFDRPDFELSYELVIPGRGISVKLLPSFLVFSGPQGRLGILNFLPQFLQYISDPVQPNVDSFDSNLMNTVVSSDYKIIVWSNKNLCITKVIQREGSIEVVNTDMGAVATYSGTEIQLSNDIVATPALGIDRRIEIWNIETGMLLLKINEDPDHYCLSFPFLNLEYNYGLNKVLDIYGSNPSTVRVFCDEGLNDDRQIETEEKPEQQVIITRFHHIILGATFSNLIVRSFLPK